MNSQMWRRGIAPLILILGTWWCGQFKAPVALLQGNNAGTYWISTWWRSWLRHWSWKVSGSIPDGVTKIFHWHNPCGRTMALVSTQSLTGMSIRHISWGVEAAGAYGWPTYHLHVPIVAKSGSLNLLQPSGPNQACTGIPVALPLPLPLPLPIEYEAGWNPKPVWTFGRSWKVSCSCLGMNPGPSGP
jgi:hypothetical protein